MQISKNPLALFDGKAILSLETATDICSVALRRADGSVMHEQKQGRGVHSEWSFVLVKRLLQQAGLRVSELGAVLLSAGPGSYTGLRIGSSAAKGLLFRTGVPLYACNTLGMIALGARRSHFSDRYPGCEAIIDARRNHVYHQAWKFVEKGVLPESEVQVLELDEVNKRWGGERLLAGSGIERIVALDDAGFSAKRESLSGSEVISAAHVLHLDRTAPEIMIEKLMKKVAPDEFEPYYYSSWQAGSGKA